MIDLRRRRNLFVVAKKANMVLPRRGNLFLIIHKNQINIHL